jgi:hypothetical protein
MESDNDDEFLANLDIDLIVSQSLLVENKPANMEVSTQDESIGKDAVEVPVPQCNFGPQRRSLKIREQPVSHVPKCYSI